MTRSARIALGALIAAGAAALLIAAESPETPVAAPPPAARAVAIFAGGCFWCMEPPFDRLPGVLETTSGYTGGSVANPSYEQVSSGSTGHRESVQVEYDPARVSYAQLLDVFWHNVDPTQADGQFCDIGRQYRSAIFYHGPEQKAVAERVIAELQAEGVWDDPIVTEVKPLEIFYPAEEYHRDYYRRNPNQGYCRAVIAPKVAKVRKLYLEKLKQPV